MKEVFDKLAPFIQEYIYQNGWTQLKPTQVAACDAIWNTDENLLLCSGTASGKTEAAFLPILTELVKYPSNSVDVLYISPLKALINDQFQRMQELLEASDIKVTRWHGDVSQNNKNKLIKNPTGILQITPESLEAMIMKKPENIITLLKNVKYVIIDEVHYFLNEDRGYQLICLLERMQRLIQKIPRRVGLSATLGDTTLAAEWLNMGTKRKCIIPKVGEEGKKIRLLVKYFSIAEKMREEEEDYYYQYLYEQTLNQKCIIFSNAKAEVESNIAHLKKIAQKKHTRDIYYAHHANVSTSLREYAEQQMRIGEENAVTGATLTLELGIDLGELYRIIQTGSPISVSSLVQRLGRSGRRGKPAEMLFLFRKEEVSYEEVFYKKINFDFLKCIAMIQLYLEEKWIEPMEKNSHLYSLLYHQTVSYLFSQGGCKPKDLAKYILTLSAFKEISQEEYKLLLHKWLQVGQLEKDQDGYLILGERGEKRANHFSFFSVFHTDLEYAVRWRNKEIGTVQIAYPEGKNFALAGYTWQVIRLDEEKRLIEVKRVGGISRNQWNDDGINFIHTKIIRKIKEVLEQDKIYGYLGKEAVEKLKEFRRIANRNHILEGKVVEISKYEYAIFSWLGTKSTLTLSQALEQKRVDNKVYFNYGIPIFIGVRTRQSKTELEKILEEIKTEDIDKYKFNISEEMVKPGKFNEMIPKELLRKQFIEDCLDVREMQEFL